MTLNPHARRLFASLFSALAFCLLVAAVRSQNNTVRRITVTPGHALNLNPTLSGDGRRIAFESTARLTGTSGGTGFHALRADLAGEHAAFTDLAASRAPAPAMSRDGSRIAFASRENPTGENADGNSEIFLHADERLHQITHTSPRDPAQRAADGNFQPSISDDGTLVAFASNRDLTGANPDANLEIFLFDATTRATTQLTETANATGSTDAKISGDGSRVAFIRGAQGSGGAASTTRDLMLFERADNSTRVIAGDVEGLSLTYGRAISTDGLRVVYSSQTAARTTQVFLYDGRNEQIRQLTALGSRATDVPLHPTISGDGSRVAFATRRNVNGGNTDASVELYLHDLPDARFSRITNAPPGATAEVVSSLNEDGSLVAFNFPRVLTETISDAEFANNSEIYLASLDARTSHSTNLQVLHGASFGKEPGDSKAIAPDQIAIVRGVNLALNTTHARQRDDGAFPQTLGGASLSVNGRRARLFYASPTQINFHVPPETETGTAQVSVRNHDGHESRAFVPVVRAAPGVFTEAGDGNGAAIALDAQTLLRSPFDPVDDANRPRRLIIFSTGLRHAQSVGVHIGGRALTVEHVLPSPDLPGLDEIHILLTRSLAGAGVVPLVVRADGRESNPTNINFKGARRPAAITLEPASASAGVGRSVRFVASVRDADGVEIANAPVAFSSSDVEIARIDASGVAHGIRPGTVTITAVSGELSATARLTIYPLTLVLNEILADPPDGAAGDANRDGARSSTQDEFIELVNATTFDLNIGGYQLTTRGSGSADTVRHTFAADTVVAPGMGVVVFGGAQAATFDPAHPAFAGALVLTASTGGLSLTNGGSLVKLLDATGATIEQLAYGGAGEPDGDRNQSLTRAPDVAGDFVMHENAPASGGRLFSPGTRLDATPFPSAAPIARIEVAPPAATVERGAQQQFTARAFDANGIELPGVIFRWQSGDTAVATIDGNGLAQTHAAGDTQITATARGVQSPPATLSVLAPRPKVARVEVAPLAASVNRGGTLQFSALAFAPDGRPLSDANFSWSSGNTSIATIDPAGLARAGGIGATTITASTSDGAGGTVAGQATLEVRVPVVLNEILADVPPDDPATNTVEGDANRDGVRSSDDDEFIEVLNYSQSPVDISGIFVSDATAKRFTFPAGTILPAGSPFVLFGGGAPPRDDPAFGGASLFTAASLGLNDSGDTVSLKLTVGDTEITIVSQTYDAATAGTPTAPRDQSLTRSPDAASDSPGGAFIAHTLATNAATRPYSPGTRADGTPFNSLPLVRIVVAPTDATVEIGATQNFRARAYAMLDGSEREVSNVSFIWDSSDAGKASVAPASGTETTARAASAGSILIRARAGGLEAAATLTINPPPPVLTRLLLSPDVATINVGGSQQFTAQAFDQYDRPFPVSSLNFNSDNAGVATIDSVEQSPASGEARANASGRAAGTAHITASATADGRSVTSNVAILNVNPPPPSIARIEITPGSATIGAGATQQFHAKAYDQNNQEMQGVAFNWTTSDASVATVDSSGLATGRGAGTTVVSASSANVESAPASLTVNAPPAPSAGQVIINEALVAFATSGTQARMDFVELYNTTGQTLDITGLVITFRPSGSGNTPQSLALANAAGDKFLIQPYGYFLIAGGADTFGQPVDFNTGAGNFDLNNTTGGIKIEMGGVQLDGLAYQGGSTPPSATFSAYGEGTLFRFTSGTTNDLIRSPNAADTNNNATDFRRNGTASTVSPKAANP
ncbi:MAG TPA: lamin tail domain-containing protein [Pyrinomonadaceae bacterium]|nr:lamin tail domain-containing protein [Pyrinomonadaceae bacterium]